MKRLVVAISLLVLAAGCSGASEDSAATEIARTAATPTPTEVVQATTDPTSIGPPAPATSPVGTSSPTPAGSPSPPATPEAAAVTLWFPKDPESYDDFGAVFPYERRSILGETATDDERIQEVLDLWMDGPDDVANFIDPMVFFDRRQVCPHDAAFERHDNDVLIIRFCGDSGSAGVGDDARIRASLSRTISEAGFGAIALLSPDGDRCLGSQNDDDPLSCLPSELRIPADRGFRCPLGRALIDATVTGADGWVNTRLGPSVEAPLVGQITVGTSLLVSPSTLTYDGVTHWWVTVQDPGRETCVWVGADFLVDDDGNLFSAVIPGLTFVLPTTGIWQFRSFSDDIAGGRWSLEGAFVTEVWVRIERGNKIEAFLTDELKRFESEGYDYPTDWYHELSLAGADRVVRPVYTISGSGDVGSNTLLIEVGDYTITLGNSVYIDDLSVAPIDEMQIFLDSIQIDRSVFLETIELRNS